MFLRMIGLGTVLPICEDSRNSSAALPQFPDKGISVHNRHHDIGHHDLRTEIRHCPETVGSVPGASYLESLFRECVGDDAGQVGLVFYEQQPYFTFVIYGLMRFSWNCPADLC